MTARAGHAGRETVPQAPSVAFPRPPTCPPVQCDGVECHVMTVQGLNMVMREHNGRWACLISHAPADRLMQIAAHLQF